MFRSLIEEIRGSVSEGRGAADWKRVKSRGARRAARYAAGREVREIDPNEPETPGFNKPQRRIRGKNLR